MKRSAFFSRARASTVLFGGHLTKPQVAGMTAILDEWDRRKLPDLRWLAYMLATTFHETVHTMQPIREIGQGKGKKYGTTYYGRGFVQLTWEANYRKASTVVAVDLVAHPDRALEMPIATSILFDGMINGWFTGHKLADHIGPAFCDYRNARRIINGADRAATIAGYAVNFERALKDAIEPINYDQPVIPVTVFPPPLRPPDDPGPDPADRPNRQGGFFMALLAFFRVLFPRGT